MTKEEFDDEIVQLMKDYPVTYEDMFSAACLFARCSKAAIRGCEAGKKLRETLNGIPVEIKLQKLRSS